MAMFPYKYKNIISRSTRIRSGSPAVYQLRPKKETFGTLTRKTVGEKNPNKKNKTILLVGETGTGKSTLINALVNYIMGVKFEDNIWFEIIEDEKRGQTESQTSDVIVYEIFGYEDKPLPYSLTIIDTPGYGDTRGIKQDEIVSERLLDLFRSEKGIHEINAVGLVMKASVNRLSDRLSYIFNSVVSLFGNDMENKIVAFITHSDGITTGNVLEALKAANIKCARNDEDQPVHFLLNNCQTTQRVDKNKVALKSAWELTMGELRQFAFFLRKTSTQKLTVTVEVLNTSIRLTACIQNLRERIEFIEGKQTEIQQTQDAVKKYEQEMKDHERFNVDVNEVYKEEEPVEGGSWLFGLLYNGAVRCKVCKENCHYPGCTRAPRPDSCEVMKDDHCTVCTRRCHVDDHVKDKKKYVTRTRKISKPIQHVKDKYEKNKSEHEKTTSLLENLEKEMKDLTAEKNQWLEESYQHVVKLQEIALNVNSLSTHVHLDFLIEKLKEKGDTEKVKKLEDMKRQKDTGVMAGLRYMFGRLTGAGDSV